MKHQPQSDLPGIITGELESITVRGHEFDRLVETLNQQGRRIISMQAWCISSWRCVIAPMPEAPAVRRAGDGTVMQGEAPVNTAAKKSRVLPGASAMTGAHAGDPFLAVDAKTLFRLPPGKICLVP